MMIRALTVSLLLAVMAAPAYAQDSAPESTPQDNPQTRQTDQSEDDYRRSQRRRDAGSIFDDIDINARGSGSGAILGREVKAIDRLDQESRRHLNKQRAKALAEANPGEPIDAAFEPSEAGKVDEYIARQEEAAWDEMMRDANSGLSGMQGQGTGGGQGQSGSGQQGQAGPDQAGQGQAGPGPNRQSGQTNTSPLRGGSASSASSILDQIKGRAGSAASPTPPVGQPAGRVQTSQGPAPQGQSAQSGQAEQDANSASGQTQNDTQASEEAQSQAQTQTQAAADAAAQAAAEAEAEKEAAHASAHRETMSPLERLKRDPVERDDAGGRTSASDYLKRGN